MTEKMRQFLKARKYFAVFSGREDIFAIKEFKKLAEEKGEEALDIIYWLFLGFSPDSDFFQQNEIERLRFIEKRVIEEEGWYEKNEHLVEAYKESLTHHVQYELAYHRSFMDNQRRIIADLQHSQPQLAQQLALGTKQLLEQRKQLEAELVNVHSQETRAGLKLSMLADGSIAAPIPIPRAELYHYVQRHASYWFDENFAKVKAEDATDEN